MQCPHCESTHTKELKRTIGLGYLQFFCRDCARQFNERTGTAYNFIEYPTNMVMLVVFHYYRFKLSLDDLVELMALRKAHLSHQTIHNWVHWFGPDVGIKMRKRRYKQVSDQWHVDVTYLRIEGKWRYLYRAIDKDGNLVDVYLSDVRDQAAAEAFFKQAAKTTGIYPEQITTDKEAAFYPAIENVFGDYTIHRDNKYKNNRLEQDHRGVKSRTGSMKGFNDIFCALRFCTVFEEIRQFFRMPTKTWAEKRRIVLSRFQSFHALFTNMA